jgi:hypothetical protein
MGGFGLLIVGIICLVINYFLPAGSTPPIIRTVLNIVGWICIIIGVILLVASLLGIALSVPIGAR